MNASKCQMEFAKYKQTCDNRLGPNTGRLAWTAGPILKCFTGRALEKRA
jgi:hypothetical protein